MHSALVSGFTRILPLPRDNEVATMPVFSLAGDPRAMFATAFLAGLVEWACIESLAPHLPDGWQTVGTHITLSHAGPASADIRTRIELVEVTGDLLRFRFACFSGSALIGAGTHERKLIRTSRFTAAMYPQTRRAIARP